MRKYYQKVGGVGFRSKLDPSNSVAVQHCSRKSKWGDYGQYGMCDLVYLGSRWLASCLLELSLLGVSISAMKLTG